MADKKFTQKEVTKKIYTSLGFALFFGVIILIQLISSSSLINFNIDWYKLIGIGIIVLALFNKSSRALAVTLILVYLLWTSGTIGRMLSNIPWNRILTIGLYVAGIYIVFAILSPKKKKG